MAIFGELAAVLLLLLPLFLGLLVGKKATKKREGPKPPKLPPGPRGLPIIGNLHQLGEHPHQTLRQLSKQHGPVMRLQLGRVPVVVVSSAQTSEQVLKTHDLLCCSRPATTIAKRLSYNFSDVVLSPYDALWRELRKITLLNLPSPKMVEGFRRAREEETEEMMGSISHLSSLSRSVNLLTLLLSFSNNIICRVAFGRRFPGQELAGDKKNGLYKLLMESQELCTVFFAGDYFSCVGWANVVSGARAKLEKNFIELDAFYQKVIAAHEDPIRVEEKEDVVDVLLRLQRDELLSGDQVKGVVTDILHAGTDTTFATLEYAMTELVKNPRTMSKAHEEVRSVVVGGKGMVEESGVARMSYLKMVVKETLRLHPVAPLLIPRETMGHVKIDEYNVFPKTRVFVNAWAIGRYPDSWDKPEEFIPERFVGSDVDFRGHNFEFLSFGAGRRICLGLSFGIMTIELALANLLYAFDWELPDNMKKEGIDMEETSGLVIHLNTNLQLQATNHVSYHVGGE